MGPVMTGTSTQPPLAARWTRTPGPWLIRFIPRRVTGPDPSGLKETVVPRSFVSPVTVSSCVLSPRAKAISCTLPPRRTCTLSHSESALTTDTPTPCKPPENW